MEIDLKEKYEKISSGWIWQKPCDDIPLVKYDKNYIKKYETYDDRLAIIRYDYLWHRISFNSLLDVGYGDGRFLKIVKSWNPARMCFGHDISGYPVPRGVEFTEYIDHRVDLVTFFDCIEHFPQKNLEDVLLQLKCKHICISVPWCHFIDFENWKHRKPNEHFHYFNVQGICTLLERGGFDLVEVSNFEDIVRKGDGKLPNILSVIGEKRK